MTTFSYSHAYGIILLIFLSSCTEQPKQADHKNLAAKQEQASPETVVLEAERPQSPLAKIPINQARSALIADLSPYLPAPPVFLAEIPRDDDNEDRACPLATAQFSTSNSDNWYTINAPAYPNTTPLSLNRNFGFTKGELSLNPNGIEIDSAGDYWASFTAVVQSEGIITVLLIRDGIFDPSNSTSQLGSVGTGGLISIQDSGILSDLEKGSFLSLVATNGGGPLDQALTIISWDISLHKICN